MIIKLTLHDNDFAELLENFGKKISNGLVGPYVIPKTHTDEYYKYLLEEDNRRRKAISLLQKSFDESSEEDRFQLAVVIHSAWNDFIKYYDQREYLMTSFDCEIVPSIPDKWANGEDVYVISTSYSNKVVTM